MNIQTSILVVAGSLSLTITLILAWCLTGLLMVFFLLFDHFRLSPPAVILLAMTIGSLLNPFGFLVLAIKLNLRQHPSTPFGAIMSGSFAMTTIGYIGAAWYVAHAAVLAA